MSVPVTVLVPDPGNVRVDVSSGLEELTESVRAAGVLQPLLVRQVGPGRYMVVDGHRRLAAAQAAGLDRVPALLSSAAAGGREVEVMLAAAMHKALEPIERATGFQRLVNAGMTVQEISRRTGYSVATVRDSLSLMELPSEARRMVAAGEITASAGVGLAKQMRASGTGDAPVRAKQSRPPSWFSRAHPLAREVKCDHAGRSRIAGVGCGQCWETAIRADERRQIRTQS